MAPIAARDSQGRFRPGVTGNPAGRPRSTVQTRRVERLLQSAVPQLIVRAVERAMQPDAGDEIIAAVLNALAAAEVSAMLRDTAQRAAAGDS